VQNESQAYSDDKTRFLFELLLLNPLSCNALYGNSLWDYFKIKKGDFPKQ
jgi:hypothetical protein